MLGCAPSGYGGFWDVAGFRDLAGFGDLGLWLGNWVFKDVLLYGSDVLSGPVIPFALGFYVVSVWGGCSFNDCTRDVCIFCQGWEQYLLAWV